jgi:recombination protein RecA
VVDKLAALKKITDKINKEVTKVNPDAPPVAFIAAGHEDLLDFGLIPTGNTAVDEALGGGFPRGTIVQIVGQEGAGKTCVCFDMIAYNQRIAREKGEQFVTIYVHLEARAFPLLPAINAGVDLDYLLIINALSSAEKTFDILMRYLWDWEKRQSQNLVDLVVIDSVTAAAPEAEMKSSEESLANSTIGRHAAMMSKAMRILSGSGALGSSLLILINQQRTNVGAYGAPQIATGGKAMGYYPKISISMRRPNSGNLMRGPKTNQETYGHTVEGAVDKNNTQVGKPHAKFEYPVIYGQGVDLVNPVLDIAIKRDIIEQTSAGRFQIEYLGETVKFHGRQTLEDKARGEAAFFQFIQNRIVNTVAATTEINAPTTEVTLDEEPVMDEVAA